MQRFTISLVVTATFAAGSANADLITNGKFETPTVPTGLYTSFFVGSSLPGWNVFGVSGTEVDIVSGSYTLLGVVFPAADGQQWLDLTGATSNSPDGVSQAVSTTIGDRYQLSYFLGNTTGGGGVYGTTSTVNVSLNGVLTFIDTNSTVSPTTLEWEQFTHTFIAGASTTTLAFQNVDPSSDSSNGIDNVVLIDLGPSVATVPEPASSGLFATGLAFLALTWRKWRRG